MMETALLQTSLRQKAIFVPQQLLQGTNAPVQEHTFKLAASMAELGYGLSEDLLKALNAAGKPYQDQVLRTLREVMGVNKNWTPLVKGWDVPTGETLVDHIVTLFANLFNAPGTRLACGHVIPGGTFPLERYNGCPFCGTPFVQGAIEIKGQGSKLGVLELWTEREIDNFFADLLGSKTALDATQVASLKLLLEARPLPQVAVGMKETLMLLIDELVARDRMQDVQNLFSSPTDILRYLWYKKTGFLQLVEPRTIVARKRGNAKHVHPGLDNRDAAKAAAKAALNLKYGRKDGWRVATWLNNLAMPARACAEIMHPKREMWVRFIRALRLAEFARRDGFERLRALLDVFYREDYEVWQGKVDQRRLRSDADGTFALLQQRPGLFARSLFANMLWFGPDATLAAFAQVLAQVPARLVLTLNMYAQLYFDKSGTRVVKPLGGIAKGIDKHPLLSVYSDDELKAMRTRVEDLTIERMRLRFAAQATTARTMYIDPQLYKMPLAIGDRSESVQDLPVALMGTEFPVLGNKVRLFLQWGVGLPAQHLDMDLSALICYPDMVEPCAFYSLHVRGATHSGDIRSIPNQVGTAEYIELDLPVLEAGGATHVCFVCNAYSNGALSPNLVVGWMDSKHKMKISERTGVAYDPSCVQHQVRITQSLSKGLVFGVLDVPGRKITWLEMALAGQTVQSMKLDTVMGFLAKLNAKLSVGNLLEVKAKAQGLTLVQEGEADEMYTMEWARNAAGVTRVLLD